MRAPFGGWWHVTAMYVYRRLATRSRRESAQKLAVAPHELGTTGVIIALCSALALSPGCWRSDLEMLAGRDTS